jgi:hypothetical protein
MKIQEVLGKNLGMETVYMFIFSTSRPIPRYCADPFLQLLFQFIIH